MRKPKAYNVMCVEDLETNVGDTDNFGIENFGAYDAEDIDKQLAEKDKYIAELEAFKDNVEKTDNQYKEERLSNFIG